MWIHDEKSSQPGGGADNGYLVRYRELKQTGEFPGFSLPNPMELEEPIDAAEPELNDQFIERLCEGIEDEERVERFRKAWAQAIGIARVNRSGLCETFPYDEFWSHALACGLAAHALSIKLGDGRPEEAFLFGFLYRLGALAMSCAFPIEYAELMELRSLSDLDDLLSVESGLFGLNHIEATHALLIDLDLLPGLSPSLFAACGPVSTSDQSLKQIITSAEGIANLCMLDEAQRSEQWGALAKTCQDLGLEREEFAELGDAVVRHWWECGDYLQIQTKSISSFLALDDTGIIDRTSLGFGRLNSAHAAGKPLSVLVVDDDPTARIILKRHLENGGYVVRTAVNGVEALNSALQYSPDIVVADWVMPEMDGLKLCQALRRYEAGRQLFFVLLTGRVEEEGAIEAFEAGVDEFMTKPFKKGVLIARMTAANRVLNLRKQIEADRRLLKDQLCRMASLAREAKDAAVTDSLTQLPNRRYATRRLIEEWAYSSRKGQPFSILMLDVDKFKQVNDTYGHDVGDSVLQRMAVVLEDATRKGEVACRFGGEEFMVICRNSTAE
ncbi:MAG: two-component system cell cycle response regulator, partial [Planctomycetota bacterium]